MKEKVVEVVVISVVFMRWLRLRWVRGCGRLCSSVACCQITMTANDVDFEIIIIWSEDRGCQSNAFTDAQIIMTSNYGWNSFSSEDGGGLGWVNIRLG